MDPLSPTHYDRLGVARHATAAVLRAAYKTQIQLHHPDRATPEARAAATAATTALNAAYAVLSDPAQRALYDRDLRQREAAALEDTFQQRMNAHVRSAYTAHADASRSRTSVTRDAAPTPEGDETVTFTAGARSGRTGRTAPQRRAPRRASSFASAPPPVMRRAYVLSNPTQVPALLRLVNGDNCVLAETYLAPGTQVKTAHLTAVKALDLAYRPTRDRQGVYRAEAFTRLPMTVESGRMEWPAPPPPPPPPVETPDHAGAWGLGSLALASAAGALSLLNTGPFAEGCVLGLAVLCAGRAICMLGQRAWVRETLLPWMSAGIIGSGLTWGFLHLLAQNP
jgi:curved DNA-binding protein CbpA